MTLSTVRQERDVHQRDQFARVVSVALFYLGFAVEVRRWTAVRLWHFPLVLVIASVLALFGWRERPAHSRALRAYWSVAGLLCTAILISSVAAWQDLALYRWRYLTLWLLFIIPGIALLLRDRVRQQAIVVGLMAGATLLALVGCARLATGHPLFDAQGIGDARYQLFLGVNRNLTVTLLLAALPFVIAGPIPRHLRAIRFPSAALVVVFIAFSGSRGGLLSLAIVGLVAVVIQPDSSRALRMLYAFVLFATLGLLAIQQLGGQATTSLDRLHQVVEGETSNSDEVRKLLLSKAWNIAIDHPLLGTGLGTFRGAYDPVLDQATTRGVLQESTYQADHNAYAGLMAEAGFPAGILFILLLMSLLASAVRCRHHVIARAAICSFSSVLFAFFFGLNYSDPVSYLTLVIGLGVAMAFESPPDDPATAVNG